jgi:hypothetical protein
VRDMSMEAIERTAIYRDEPLPILLWRWCAVSAKHFFSRDWIDALVLKAIEERIHSEVESARYEGPWPCR